MFDNEIILQVEFMTISLSVIERSVSEVNNNNNNNNNRPSMIYSENKGDRVRFR